MIFERGFDPVRGGICQRKGSKGDLFAKKKRQEQHRQPGEKTISEGGGGGLLEGKSKGEELKRDGQCIGTKCREKGKGKRKKSVKGGRGCPLANVKGGVVKLKGPRMSE